MGVTTPAPLSAPLGPGFEVLGQLGGSVLDVVISGVQRMVRAGELLAEVGGVVEGRHLRLFDAVM